MKKIIVLQQNDLLVSMCIDKLRTMLPSSQFAVLVGTRALHNLIEPDADQFFITGAINTGTDHGVAELVDELREKILSSSLARSVSFRLMETSML